MEITILLVLVLFDVVAEEETRAEFGSGRVGILVLLLLFGFEEEEDLKSSKTFCAFLRPNRRARSSGVSLLALRAVGDAPCSSRNCANSALPDEHA